MFKTTLDKRSIFLMGVMCLTPLVSYGQQIGGDLGSSGLFKKSDAKAKSAAKPPAKTPAPAKPKTAAAKAAPKPKPVAAKPKPKPVRQNTAKRPARENNAVNTPPANERVFNASASSADLEDRFEQSLDDGNISRDNRNYNSAEASYKKAHGLKPRDSRAVYGLGNLYSDQQRWEDAEKAYREAITLEPDAPEAYVALGFVLTQPIAGADVADRYVEAEKMTRKAIGLDRNNAVAYDQLGSALELQGKSRSRDTEDAYRKAIELAPGYSLPYAHLARLKEKNGQIAESREFYQKAYQTARDVPSLILVADTLQSTKHADAERLLREALSIDPKNPMALFILSDVLVRQQKFAEAEKVLRESLQISQNSYTPNSKLGDLFLQLRRYDEAEGSFLRALQYASPTEKTKLAGPNGFTGVGDGFLKLRRYKEAVRAYSKAKQIDPKNAELSAKLSGAEKLAL
jgi:tetratricopeptide (TPR) repeat protein